MVLTPKDIQDKNFRSQIRGYDRNQVDGFLDQIIQDYSQQFDYIHGNFVTDIKLIHY